MDLVVGASPKRSSVEATKRRVPGLHGPVASLQGIIDRARSFSRRSKASVGMQKSPASGGLRKSDTPGSPAELMMGQSSQKSVPSMKIQGAAVKPSPSLPAQPRSTPPGLGGLRSGSSSDFISMASPIKRPRSAPPRPRQLQEDLEAAAPELALASEHLELSQEEAHSLFANGLPHGWVACQAEEGEVYYHHTSTSTSQWEHPAVTRSTRFQTISNALLSGTTEEPQVQHSVYDAKSRHVNLPTPQSLFSGDAGLMVRREDLLPRAFALHGLLSNAEAGSYVQAAESHGFHDSDVSREFPSDVRSNSRLIHFSDALAGALWRRLAPHLVHRDIYLIQPMGYGAAGRWKPVGVNPCFRISRYNVGEHFAAHRDGMYVNENIESSIYSVVLYLNEDFSGGELELPHNTMFKPRTGTAVLFPHDTLHTAHAPVHGTKYVARTELMFRCVDARPAPSMPNFVCDPAFQRMAGLYAQIGDLAALGNAAKTTAAYQEALGLQISHKGTTDVADAGSSLPLPRQFLARTLSFLTLSELLATATVSCDWQAATMAGCVWQYRCQQRWPTSQEVIEDTFEQFDPEMKDWFGLYKHLHLTSKSSTCVCTVFVTDQLEAGINGGDAEFHPVPARAYHTQSGHPWDSSMKHRQGWQIGCTYNEKSWFQDGVLNWQMLPEFYNHVFCRMQIDPSLHRLLVPALPGILSKSERVRLARILTGRFKIPKISIVPAPLCALLSRNMTTGTVVWGCSMGRSVVSCYVDAEEVLVVGPFNFQLSGPDDIAALLQQASRSLTEDTTRRALENIVFSVHGPAKVNKQRRYYYGEDHPPDDEESNHPPAWASADEVRKLLTFNAQLHEHLKGDIVAGGAILAAMPDHLARFEVKPPASLNDSNSWEWRFHAEGMWHRLPSYCAGVFESALRNGLKSASVCVGFLQYFLADLDNFTISAVHRHRGRFGVPNKSCRLTRFLRGHPSPTPERRILESVRDEIQDEMELIEEVSDDEALHVRTMAGRLVLSMLKSDVRKLGSFVQELLEELASRCHAAPAQLKLLYHGRSLEPGEALQLMLEESGTIELLLIVGEKAPDPDQEAMEEFIVEDWPGEGADLKQLERFLY